MPILLTARQRSRLGMPRTERYPEAERDISTGEALNPNARTLKTLRGMYRDAVDPVSPSIIIDDRRGAVADEADR